MTMKLRNGKTTLDYNRINYRIGAYKNNVECKENLCLRNGKKIVRNSISQPLRMVTRSGKVLY